MSRKLTHKPRPDTWTFPYNEKMNQANLCYLRAKAQAKFRKEYWDLTFDDWWAKWEASGQWENRGRNPTQYCMLQKDTDKGWTKDNAIVTSRTEHYNTQHKRRKQGYDQPEWDSTDLRFRVARPDGTYRKYDYDAVVGGLKKYHEQNV